MLTCRPLDPDTTCNAIYTDGGVFGKNPSKDGGSWAFVAVQRVVPNDPKSDLLETSRSGIVLPSDIGMETVENNITETIAILLSLESLPEGWIGTFYGDNLNALRRAAKPREIKKVVPQFIKDRMIAATARVKVIEYVLLGGHPNKAELDAGRRSDGKPVSQWNVLADSLCGAESVKFYEKPSQAVGPGLACVMDQRVRDCGKTTVTIKKAAFPDGYKHRLNSSTCIVRKFEPGDVVRMTESGDYIVEWPPPSATAGISTFDGSEVRS